MGLAKTLQTLLYLSIHPRQLRSIIQWKVWHEPVHTRDPSTETLTLRQCFYYLQMTSRSFSAVILELHPELLVPVALFYLALRGLDTIEDDMTIPLEIKEPLLRDFHNLLEKEGWTFDGCGPDEKDRQLLVHYDCVVTEFRKIKPVYRAIIKDVTQKMGNGMADYANNAEHNIHGVNTIDDYKLYCHYVAGLVGDGLTRLFLESGLANPALAQRPELTESMGQLLQQTNIIRDIREDWDDKRRFWPKEVWSKYVTDFSDLFLPENTSIALDCSSEMVLIALKNLDHCLFYMAGVKDQSVFNFVAIPQCMAIATLELVFMNPQVFRQNVKITKGDACQLMMEASQNLRVVCEVFKRYARRISSKNKAGRPLFLEISIACANVERFIETIYPTQDPEAIAVAYGKVNAPTEAIMAKKKVDTDRAERESRREVCYIMTAVVGVLLLITALMLGIAYIAGARFDLAIEDLRRGNIFPKISTIASETAGSLSTVVSETLSSVASSVSDIASSVSSVASGVSSVASSQATVTATTIVEEVRGEL